MYRIPKHHAAMLSKAALFCTLLAVACGGVDNTPPPAPPMPPSSSTGARARSERGLERYAGEVAAGRLSAAAARTHSTGVTTTW